MLQVMVDGISYVEAADVKNMPHFQMGVYQPLYEATTSYAEDIRAFALEHAERINKINMYHTDSASRARTQERLRHLPLDFTFAEETSLETTPQGVSKGSGWPTFVRYSVLPLRTPSVSEMPLMTFRCWKRQGSVLPWGIPMRQRSGQLTSL